MRRLPLLALLVVTTTAGAVDYRELRANFDDYLARAGGGMADAQATAREAKEAEDLSIARGAAEQIRRDFQARQSGTPASAITKKKPPITAGSIGVVDPSDPAPPRDAKRVHGGTGLLRPAAPAGYVWLFALDPSDFSIAPGDPEMLTREQRRLLESESAQRARARFPFLADRKDPRRSQFDHFLRDHAEMPLFQTLFSLTRWPELAAAECGRLNQW
jgi:hypothetical protein